MASNSSIAQIPMAAFPVAATHGVLYTNSVILSPASASAKMGYKASSVTHASLTSTVWTVVESACPATAVQTDPFLVPRLLPTPRMNVNHVTVTTWALCLQPCATLLVVNESACPRATAETVEPVNQVGAFSLICISYYVCIYKVDGVFSKLIILCWQC